MENNQFNYKYTALSDSEKREIEFIKNQYEQREKPETKIQKIRRLNSKVNNTASITALCVGLVACLIFGLGLAMILEWEIIFPWGVVVSAMGLIPMACAYPIYNYVLNRNKKKYGEEILKLSNELLNEENNKSAD